MTAGLLLAFNSAALAYGPKSKRVAAKPKRAGFVPYLFWDALLSPSLRSPPAVSQQFSSQCSFIHVVPFLTASDNSHFLLLSFTSFVIALGELPFCLGWIPAVKTWSASVAPYLEQYWARALVYTGFVTEISCRFLLSHFFRSTGVGWCFAYQLDKDCWWIMFWGISLIISGMLYGWAYFRGERFEDEASARLPPSSSCAYSVPGQRLQEHGHRQ
jgi:hypothetical protein